MKFELVEFYPAHKSHRNKSFLGSVHIYVIDFELDIRGILVFKRGKKPFFQKPYSVALDAETGERVRFPLVGWSNTSREAEMMEFLNTQVCPEIMKRLNLKEKKSEVKK
jgi:hypothetical protein